MKHRLFALIRGGRPNVIRMGTTNLRALRVIACDLRYVALTPQ